MTTPEQIEVGRWNLLAQLKQALRRADLEEYPVDVATMRDLVEVLGALGPIVPVCSNCLAMTFACTACGARVEEYR